MLASLDASPTGQSLKFFVSLKVFILQDKITTRISRLVYIGEQEIFLRPTLIDFISREPEMLQNTCQERGETYFGIEGEDFI